MMVGNSSVDSDRTETESVRSASSSPSSPTPLTISTLRIPDTNIEDDGSSSPAPPPVSIAVLPASAKDTAARSTFMSRERVPVPRNTDPSRQNGSTLRLDEIMNNSIELRFGLKTHTATPCAP